jgi:hypothetical protein
MQKTILEALSVLPFILITRNQDGSITFNLSMTEILRSVVVPLVIGIGGVLLTIQIMKKDIEFQAATLNRIETKMNSVCEEVSSLARELAVVKTKQDERIEREHAQGLRNR